MATFIQSSKSFHFKNPDGESEFKVPFGYVGEAPDWVTKTPLFGLAVKGKDITFIGKEQESPKEEASDDTAKKRGKQAAK